MSLSSLFISPFIRLVRLFARLLWCSHNPDRLLQSPKVSLLSLVIGLFMRLLRLFTRLFWCAHAPDWLLQKPEKRKMAGCFFGLLGGVVGVGRIRGLGWGYSVGGLWVVCDCPVAVCGALLFDRKNGLKI